MRKYTAYRQGEERFDGHLYRIIARTEQKARENPRVNAPPPPPPPVPEVQEPKPEAPTTICPARQVMNIYRELEAEKAREKLEKARRMLARKAEIAARYLRDKN
ncbi:hypothetical protein [Salmonella enterica]|uniref:hypothetical protein n=1 Tax=Salmonella enterica TaxID=28901 RepID=UPI00193DA8DE|nr:hypothetical protein [Salmonella enterica]EEN5588392.1 hypothetical protein [Salmonella enterica subsp. enterica serovar Mountpleasant]EIO3283235.1 hypothetical protein [Salmonella enterica]